MLKYTFPLSTKIFAFEGNSKYIDIEFYLEGLYCALPVTTNVIYIRWWTLSCTSIETVIKYSAKATKVVIAASKIDCSSEFDFAGPDYNVEYLGLIYCKNLLNGGLLNINRIIKAISESSMKFSLKTLNLFKCKLHAQIVMGLLDKCEMGHVKLIDECIDMSSD